MTIVWGRDNVWDQPDPSVLTLTMWEPQPGEWLRKVVEKKAIRRGVLVSFRRQDGAVDKDVIIFQGFTTNVDVQASQQLTDSGMTDGWMVQIQATDRSGFLGQENWGAQVLPEQSMQERAVRIRNQAAPTGIRQFYFEDHFKSGIVGAMDVTDKTVLDMVTGMYTSFADQWTYIPARNVVNRIPGGSNFQPYTLLLGVTYLAGSSVKLYPPTWGDPTGKEDPIDTAAYPTAYIGACDVTGGIALSSNMIQDITHISCKWYNKPGGAWHVTTLTVKDETPRSRLEFESVVQRWNIRGSDIGGRSQYRRAGRRDSSPSPAHVGYREVTGRSGLEHIRVSDYGSADHPDGGTRRRSVRLRPRPRSCLAPWWWRRGLPIGEVVLRAGPTADRDAAAC